MNEVDFLVVDDSGDSFYLVAGTDRAREWGRERGFMPVEQTELMKDYTCFPKEGKQKVRELLDRDGLSHFGFE